MRAASKGLLAGEKETAAQLAERVQKLVGDKPVPGDYWKMATVVEVQLVRGKIEATVRLFRPAVSAHCQR